MAINFIKKEDLTHICRTTKQWETTVDRYEIIPKGVLCIELCNDKLTKIKIGNGHLIYELLPYVSGVDLSDYYTKEETNTIIKNLKSIKIKGEASSLSDLPLSGNDEGDLWFIQKQSPDDNDRYDEYVWYKNKWESLGSSDIDLSEYAKKEYVDQHIQEVQNEITEIIESGYLHKHTNKEILDQTTAVFNTEKDQKLDSLHNYDDSELRNLAHTHLNKNILDQTDAVFNRDKDDKLASLENYDDTYIQDRLSILEQVAHFHDNMEILNRTTAAFTREQAIQLLDCKDFEGATSTSNGYHGFVPAPLKADRERFLRGDGVWAEVQQGGGGDTITPGGGIDITTDAQTGVKTVSVNVGTGLEIDQQTGALNVTSEGTTYTFESNTDGSFTVTPDGEEPQVVTTYEHPTYTTHQSGLYVITVDETGHISNATAATGNDLPAHEHTVSDITDFPSLGTASSYDVPESGDAANDEVVLGNDSRLTDARTPVSHTHTESDITDLGPYAEGATHNGAAVSSNKLNIGNSDIGSTTQPVYFDKTTGLPVAIGYTIEKSVPSDAEFTDTTYDDFVGSGTGHAHGLVPDPGSTQGNSRYLCEDGTWTTPTIGDVIAPGDGIDVTTDQQTGNKVVSVKYADGLTVDANGAIKLETPVTQFSEGEAIVFKEQGFDLDYYFDTQIACEYHGDFNRTFTKTTTDPCYAITWRCYDNNKAWTGPLLVGETADSVKYTTMNTTYNAKGSFTYLNKTWYYSDTAYFVSNTDGVDYQHNLQLLSGIYPSVNDQVQACKDFLDLISLGGLNQEINVKYGDGLLVNQDNELEVSLGNGLLIDENDDIAIDPDILPPTYFPGTAIVFEDTSKTDITIDSWNNGTNWGNWEYYNDTSPSYISWNENLMKNPSSTDNLFEVPTGVTQAKCSAISNDGVTQLSTRLYFYNSSGTHFAASAGSTDPNTIINIPAGTVYINQSIRNPSGSGNIYTSNVSAATITWIDATASPEVTVNIWNGGNGWANGAYTAATGDSFIPWGSEVHSDRSNSWEIPEGVTKVKVEARSNDNTLLHPTMHWLSSQSGGRFGYGCPTGTDPYDAWVDIPTNAVYTNIGIRWQQGSGTAISTTDIKSVKLTWYGALPVTGNLINVNYGDGLTVNQDNELEVNLGDGLSIDSNGALTLDDTITIEICGKIY